MKFDSLRSVFQKKTSMQTCRTIKSLWAGGGWVGTTSWGQQWRGQLCGRWEPKRAGKLRDKPAGSWVWPFPPSTKQAQTPSLLHYAIGFKEIFELCMHFYIVILYHLSQLDLLVTLNAASRKHLLQSWDPVMLYLLLFIFIRKKPYSFMHESSSTIGASYFYHSNHFMQNFEYMHSLFSILQQRCNISYSDYSMLTAKWIYAETTQHHTCQGYYVSWII